MAGKTSVKMSWDSKQVEALTVKAIRAGLTEAGKHGRKAIKAELGGAKGSPEGGAPGKDTGNLRRAVAYKLKAKKGKFVVVDVGVLRPSAYDSKAGGKSFPGRMHAQAVRLSRGYTGRDRDGRVYHQKGRPFVEPVLKREKKRMATIVQTEAGKWMPKPKEKN